MDPYNNSTSNWGNANNASKWSSVNNPPAKKTEKTSYAGEPSKVLSADSKKTNTSDSTDKWGKVSQENELVSAWGASLVNAAFSQQQPKREVDAISRDFIFKSSVGKGPLSFEVHEEQMKEVENLISSMVTQVKINISDISMVIKEFMQEVFKSNKKIGAYVSSIIDRGIRNDPTLGPDDVTKAERIVKFSGVGIEQMKISSDAALEMADKGGGIISKQTMSAIALIFDARTKQVALFSQKIEVFQKQEKHDLEMMLGIQESRLKEQAQLFGQLKEVVQLKLAQNEARFKQEVEIKKVKFEQHIQLRSLELKEEEAHMAHTVKLEEIKQNTNLKEKALEADKELRHEENQYKFMIDKEKNQNALIVDQQKIATDERVQNHKINSEHSLGMANVVASIVKPPCIVM